MQAKMQGDDLGPKMSAKLKKQALLKGPAMENVIEAALMAPISSKQCLSFIHGKNDLATF
uniref:Uncharacterized protein n=1 Tax=Romanomermis culicivorax TaxID=13658 RepID=A0A915JCK6_ROMCU